MKLHPLFLLLLCWCVFTRGQTDARHRKIDSLTVQLSKDSARIYRKTIARPYLRVENRRSFIVEEKVNFLGFLAGANLHERHVVCAGYYFLDRRSNPVIRLKDDNGASQQFSKLNYAVLSYQYILLNERFIQLNTPIEAGYGNYTAHFTDSSTSSRLTDLDGNFVPLCAGLQVILKPLKWMGFSGSGGYRYVRQDALRLSFNGWYYSFGVWVDARYLFRGFRYHLHKRRYRHEVRQLR